MSHLQYIASQGSVHQARHERDIYFGSLICVLFLLHFELQTLIKTFSEEGEISVQEQYIVGKDLCLRSVPQIVHLILWPGKNVYELTFNDLTYWCTGRLLFRPYIRDELFFHVSKVYF